MKRMASERNHLGFFLMPVQLMKYNLFIGECTDLIYSYSMWKGRVVGLYTQYVFIVLFTNTQWVCSEWLRQRGSGPKWLCLYCEHEAGIVEKRLLLGWNYPFVCVPAQQLVRWRMLVLCRISGLKRQDAKFSYTWDGWFFYIYKYALQRVC